METRRCYSKRRWPTNHTEGNTMQERDTDSPGEPQQREWPYRSPYGATPPPPPSKKRRLGWQGWTFIGLLLLGFVFAVAAVNGNKQDTAATGASATVSSAPSVLAAVPSDLVAPPSSAPPSSAPPAPTVVLTLSGNGTKTTKSFTTGDDWSIKYTFDCSNFDDKGNFQVYTYTDGSMGDIPVNELAASGADTTYEHGDPGSHYLEINSECDWTVTVTDGAQ